MRDWLEAERARAEAAARDKFAEAAKRAKRALKLKEPSDANVDKRHRRLPVFEQLCAAAA